MANICSIKTGSCRAIRGYVRPYGTIQDYTGPYGPIQEYMGTYEAIGDHQDQRGLLEAIQGHKEPYGA